ncbi:MAG: hypothetical protein IT460_11955 [Planctomycetes bacterium]|nr:hypothetical protein [Planctomycetota bacterium]
MSGAPVDSIAVVIDTRRDPLRRRLDDLLTRSFYSAAGYVFECDPFAVAADDDVFRVLGPVREQDRRHAHVLGTLIERRGGVPAPGVFPWWNLDLNFLTVPALSQFVLDALHEEVGLYDATIAAWPADDVEGRAALGAIRAEKARQVAELRPVVAAALAREAEGYKTKAAQVKKVRDARIAKEKAAAEAARKAKQAGKPGAAPAAATAAPAASSAPAVIGDPNEPGISKKEKGRRALLRIRQRLGIAGPKLPTAAAAAAPSSAAAAAAAPVAAAPAAASGAALDPNEPGISPKEKARRKMLQLRGPAAAATPAPAAAPAPAAPAPAAAPMLDPDEPGISPKEKARRKMLQLRAASGAAPVPSAPAAAAAAPPPAAPTAPAVEALPADLGDPNEPGLSPKEKARRTMARLRAQRGG